eukprot:jgi/Hompol1/1105/HPOL_005515-RA
MLDDAAVESIVHEFSATMSQLVAAAAKNELIGSFWKLSAKYEERISRLCHGPRVPLPSQLAHQGFQQRVKLHPNWHAVECDNHFITYSELDRCSNALAASLELVGVRNGTCVIIAISSGIELPVAVLSIAKLGSTIVPLDFATSDEFMRAIISSVAPVAVLTTADTLDRIQKLGIADLPITCVDMKALFEPSDIEFEANIVHEATSADPFMIACFFNSEGTLLCTPVSHATIVNVAWSLSPVVGIFARTRFLMLDTLDLALAQSLLIGCLNHGATVVMNKSEDAIRLSSIEAVVATPLEVAILSSSQRPRKLRYITLTEVPSSSALIDFWSPHATINCIFGQVETGIISHFGPPVVNSHSMSIGKPAPNSVCYVLDQDLRIVPIGVVGRLYIGGIDPSCGYMHQQIATQECFLQDPFVPGRQIFKTGEAGMLLPDGTFEIVGRSIENDDEEIQDLLAQTQQLSEKSASSTDVSTEMQSVGTDIKKAQQSADMLLRRISTKPLPVPPAVEDTPAPADNAAEPESPPKIIRILCFHGMGSNSDHMDFQLWSLGQAFQDRIEFISINLRSRYEESKRLDFEHNSGHDIPRGDARFINRLGNAILDMAKGRPREDGLPANRAAGWKPNIPTYWRYTMISARPAKNWASAFSESAHAAEHDTTSTNIQPPIVHESSLPALKLEALATKYEVDPAILVRFAWGITHYRLFRQSECVLGVLLDNGRIVPCRVSIYGNDDVKQYLKKLQSTHNTMLDFCDVSLDDLYKWVRFNVDSGERLFNTVLSFGDINDKGLETADSGLKLAFKWDRSQDDRITTTALYSSGELSHESVNHILDEFEKSLRNIVETLEQPNADGIPYCISDLTKIEPQKPKIRIVCLHGYGSHAEHTRFMVGVLSARYDRLIEFICLQSPLEATDSGNQVLQMV